MGFQCKNMKKIEKISLHRIENITYYFTIIYKKVILLYFFVEKKELFG